MGRNIRILKSRHNRRVLYLQGMASHLTADVARKCFRDWLINFKSRAIQHSYADNTRHTNLPKVDIQIFVSHEHLPPADDSLIFSNVSSGPHSCLFCFFLHNLVHRVLPFFLQRHLSLQSFVMKTRPRLNRRPST